jgi:hypothetical protein
MIGNLFHRPNREEELFAEAQALVDDGLDLQFVLALYPDDAEWLERLLDTGIVIGESFAEEEPSYYFEASLKNRFIDAGTEKAVRRNAPVSEPVAVVPAGPVAGLVRFQGMMAGTAVALLLGAMSVATLGMVTAGDSVPGDWNYAFKLAGERIEYSLSSGNERVDVRLNHTFARIQELQKLNERGDVSPQVIEGLRHDLEEIDSLARQRPLDPVQQANARAIGEAVSAVLDEVLEEQPELAEQIEPTIAMAAAIADGAVTTVSEPTATPTEEPTATPEPSPTESPSPTPTAEAEESPSAEATEQPLEVEPAPAPEIEAPAE